MLLFRESLVLHTDGDGSRLDTVARQYHEVLHRIASGQGWTGAVDFCDLSKIVRLAGTINKRERPRLAAAGKDRG